MASHAMIETPDIGRLSKLAMFTVAGLLAGATALAVARVLAGLTPATFEAKQIAVIVHLCAVLPAIPLGLWVLLRRKGDALHKALGRLWAALMLTAAVSAIFIRNLNHGNFSWLHLFVLLVFVTLFRGIGAARAGRIRDHKRHMWGMYVGALLLPGLFAFLPGRLLWHWLML